MKKYDIFISYSREDKDIALEFCQILDEYKKHYDFEYFFDCEEITSKHDYLERISSAISQSKGILFLASKNSLESEFCLKELLFAEDEHVHIYQYRLDCTEYPKPIQLLLGNYQYRESSSFSKNEMVREVLAETLNQEIQNLHTDQNKLSLKLFWSKYKKWILLALLICCISVSINDQTEESNIIDDISTTIHSNTEEKIEETTQPAAEEASNVNDNVRHLIYNGVPMNMDISSFADRLTRLNYVLVNIDENNHFYEFKQNNDIIRVHWDEQNNNYVYLVEDICTDFTEDDLNNIMYTFADEYGQEPEPFNEWAEGICLEEGAILFGLDEENHVVIMFLDKANSRDYKLL